jgi:peptide/nickel transport system substrate-binding protein
VIFAFTPDFNSIFTRVFAGEADIAEPVSNIDLLKEAATHPELVLRSTPGSDYGFIQMNLRDPRDATKPNPLFADRGVRIALAHAIDRPSIVKSVFDSLALPGVGPMTRWQQLADTTVPFPAYDPSRTTTMLDSLGWKDSRGTGVREKKGVPLKFSLIIPNTSRSRQRLSVLLQDAFKKVGVQMEVDQMDLAAYRDRLTKGNFEATIMTWHTDPSLGSLSQTWGSAGSPMKGGQNFGDYESRMFDQAVDSALTQRDPEKGRAYFRRAFEVINSDVPAIWLYEPRWNAFVHRRIRVSGIRPDAWWAGLADWTIPANERIARDKMTLDTTRSR